MICMRRFAQPAQLFAVRLLRGWWAALVVSVMRSAMAWRLSGVRAAIS